MAFILHLSFTAFYMSLVKGNVVYSAVYFLKDRPGTRLLLTSEVGNRIHAIQLTITNDTGADSFDLIEGFFRKSEITITRGAILLTDGLQDAIRYWGSTFQQTLEELGGELSKITK